MDDYCNYVWHDEQENSKRGCENEKSTSSGRLYSGALTCGNPGIELEGYITRLTKTFLNDGDFIVLPVDVHEIDDSYHPETKQFPPHNIRDTAGRNLYGSLHELYNENRSAIKWMDKTRFSAFAGTELELLLRARDIKELHLVGVCTDICILHTAVDAYNRGFSIVIHEKGVASFNLAGHEWAIQHFEHTLGATIIR